ncbi:ABC transporter permease [Loktanella sp. S4079]|uniref:ABC transporter permease n=1 Tax=Loktanella sp. S4079 TaxID=579483 RepID=UPI0005FA3C28|nr:ABC transporter permease [Loktanella sp. S4079]KJZ18360.1 ABC transporter permease [Loktanella sp. S4079]
MTVRAISILGLLGFWFAVAAIAANPTVLPMPQDLIAPISQEIATGELPYHLGMTLIRVVWAFALAMGLGCILGLVMGLFPTIDRWLDPWLVVFLNLPALVLIVLCYLWIGLNETAAITAVTLNKIPNVTTIIREGARSLNPDLSAMAKVFGMRKSAILRHIILPQLGPFVTGAARSGIAVIWKIVLVVEFLGRSNGIGFQIHLYFQLFDVALVLVYALSFIAVMLLVEWVILQPWERRARRWRQA